MASTIDPSIAPLTPTYAARPGSAAHDEPAHLASLIQTLNLQPHIEGGYFVETDRDTRRVPNPFASSTTAGATAGAAAAETTFYTATGSVSADLTDKPGASDRAAQDPQQQQRETGAGDTRSASTSIHYLLTPRSPLGAFHRNRGRTVHTLHAGRGRYVVIHADEVAAAHDGGARAAKARVETFVVGRDVARGERLQWVVDGGKYKASFLLDGRGDGDGLLISETVVPGFEYSDHDFMRADALEALVEKEQAEELGWLLRRDGGGE